MYPVAAVRTVITDPSVAGNMLEEHFVGDKRTSDSQCASAPSPGWSAGNCRTGRPGKLKLAIMIPLGPAQTNFKVDVGVGLPIQI